jgi:hypothetical protein
MHIRKLVMAGPETWILSAAEKFWAVGHPDLAIDLLRAFVAMVETGKLHGSGDVVGRLQSAVRQKVFRLEAILRRRIFERTSRSLSVRTR